MPKIYEYFGLVFLFYANDHTPIHVHARSGDFESKLEYVYDNGKLVDIAIKSVKGKKKLPENLLKDAIKFAAEKENEIVSKWVDFFAKNKKPNCEKVTKRL